MPSRRRPPGRLVAAALVVLLVLAAGWWWRTGDDVAWAVDLRNAAEVLDHDDDRILVRTFDDTVVVLDRDDGEQVGEAELPFESIVQQAALVDDGFVTLSRQLDGEAELLSVFDADGGPRWQRDDPGLGQRLLAVPPDTGLIALWGGDDDEDRLLGLDLADGSVRWSSPGDSPGVVPLSTGPLLREVGVTLAKVGPADRRETAMVDLTDGTTLGVLDEFPERLDGVAYWRDVVVVLDGNTLLRAVAGASAPLEGTEELPADVYAIGEVSEGAAAVSVDDGTWGLDLEAGRVTPLPVEVDLGDEARTVGGPSDGDSAVVVDLGTGEELARLDDVEPPADGPDSVLVYEDPSFPVAWRHGIGDADDADRLRLLSRDGEFHGAWYGTLDERVDVTVLDQHEAVVITKETDESGPHQVILLGR